VEYPEITAGADHVVAGPVSYRQITSRSTKGCRIRVQRASYQGPRTGNRLAALLSWGSWWNGLCAPRPAAPRLRPSKSSNLLFLRQTSILPEKIHLVNSLSNQAQRSAHDYLLIIIVGVIVLLIFVILIVFVVSVVFFTVVV
jgi:hypothetical protein